MARRYAVCPHYIRDSEGREPNLNTNVTVTAIDERDVEPLKSFAQRLAVLNGSTERRTVTLTQIIEQARGALAQFETGGEG